MCFPYHHKHLLHETEDGMGGEVSKTYASTTDDEFGDLISETGSELYHQFDAQANTNALLDEAGNVAARFRYDAFGNVLAASVEGDAWATLTVDPQWATMTVDQWAELPVELTTQLGMVGQKQYYRDAETELYLLGGGTNGRYYDPKLGRFVSEDPVRQAGGDPNLYPYVQGNPVNRLDPSGHTSIDDPDRPEEESARKQVQGQEKEHETKQPTADSHSQSTGLLKSSDKQQEEVIDRAAAELRGRLRKVLGEDRAVRSKHGRVPRNTILEARRRNGRLATPDGIVIENKFYAGNERAPAPVPPGPGNWEYVEEESGGDCRTGETRIARLWRPLDAEALDFLEAEVETEFAARRTEVRRFGLEREHQKVRANLKELNAISKKDQSLRLVLNEKQPGYSVYVEDVQVDGENFKVVWAPAGTDPQSGELVAKVVGVVPAEVGSDGDKAAAQSYFDKVRDAYIDAAGKTVGEAVTLAFGAIQTMRAAAAAARARDLARAARAAAAGQALGESEAGAGAGAAGGEVGGAEAAGNAASTSRFRHFDFGGVETLSGERGTRLRFTVDDGGKKMWVDMWEVTESQRKTGVGRELFKEALSRHPNVTEIRGEAALDNLAKLVETGDIHQTPFAKAVKPLGFKYFKAYTAPGNPNPILIASKVPLPE